MINREDTHQGYCNICCSNLYNFQSHSRNDCLTLLTFRMDALGTIGAISALHNTGLTIIGSESVTIHSGGVGKIDAPATASALIITYILGGADAVYRPVSLICAKGGSVRIITSEDIAHARLIWTGTRIDINDAAGDQVICDLLWLSWEYIRVVSAPV